MLNMTSHRHARQPRCKVKKLLERGREPLVWRSKVNPQVPKPFSSDPNPVKALTVCRTLHSKQERTSRRSLKQTNGAARRRQLEGRRK